MSIRLALTMMIIPLLAVYVSGVCESKPTLKFRTDGSFKIVQFTDIQDDADIDPRTVAGMGRILDAEKPDFVVVTGDCVYTPNCSNLDQLKKAVDSAVQPMESRGIPWAVTIGNHDHEGLPNLGISSDEYLRLYMAYKYNVNRKSPKGVFGAGNADLLVEGSSSDAPAFGIWLIDSNAHLSPKDGMGTYDWIHMNQVDWYRKTSESLEKQYHQKIPSLMFFHIPTRDFLVIAESRKFIGELNEPPCPSQIDSGLVAAAVERGDVRGMFVGHEHVNTFVGDWCGMKLGYGGSIGYGTYGMDSTDEAVRNSIRGARIFTIDEHSPKDFKTFYLKVTDLDKNTAPAY